MTRTFRRRANHRLHVEILESRTLLSVTPNDPGLPSQWGLNNSNNVDIDAPEAWGISTGSSSVVVAEIEGRGVSISHADLATKIWTNPTPNSDPRYPGAVNG